MRTSSIKYWQRRLLAGGGIWKRLYSTEFADDAGQSSKVKIFDRHLKQKQVEHFFISYGKILFIDVFNCLVLLFNFLFSNFGWFNLYCLYIVVEALLKPYI